MTFGSNVVSARRVAAGALPPRPISSGDRLIDHALGICGAVEHAPENVRLEHAMGMRDDDAMRSVISDGSAPSVKWAHRVR